MDIIWIPEKGDAVGTPVTQVCPRKTPSWSRCEAKASGIRDLLSHANSTEWVGRVLSI